MIDNTNFSILTNVLFLKTCILFENITSVELKSIAIISEEIYYEASDEIVREGEIGDSLYLIKNGSVEIRSGIGKKSSLKGELFTGDYFGDVAVVNETVWMESYYARAKCSLLVIKKDDLVDIMRENPEIAIAMLHFFAKRIQLLRFGVK
jgi:CRP-like cAMP-binding protein